MFAILAVSLAVPFEVTTTVGLPSVYAVYISPVIAPGGLQIRVALLELHVQILGSVTQS